MPDEHDHHRHVPARPAGKHEDEIGARIFHLLCRAPAWLGSALVHVLVLLLALSLHIDMRGPDDLNNLRVGFGESLGPESPLFHGEDYLDDPLDVSDPLQADTDAWDENQTDRDVADNKSAADAGPTLSSSDMFSLRSDGGRMEAVKRGGGTAGSEAAVANGLDWLFRHQNGNGCWSPADYHENCDANAGCGKGKPGYKWMDPACTGLGLMCFLGSGYTGEQTRYRGTVNRAIGYFLKHQKPDGSYMRYTVDRVMYNHAIATLAMSEAYAMTRRSDVRKSVEKAIAFIARSQNDDGGWRYNALKYPRSDTSVTGWVVMAVKSAKLGGIQVADELFDGAKRWLDYATHPESGVVGYTNPGNCIGPSYPIEIGNMTVEISPGTTAVGMLCRQFMGTPRSDPSMRKAAVILQKCPPRFGDPQTANLYYYYYAMLALYQYGGKPWDEWNPKVRDPLVRTQETQGCARGSWRPSFYWAQHGDSGPGRIYATAMAILTLEVYYRYLPIYKSDESLSDIDRALIAYKDALESYRDFVSLTGAKPPKPEGVAKAAQDAEQRILNYLTADRDVADLTVEQERRRAGRRAASNMRLAMIYLHTKRFAQAMEVADYIERTYPQFKGADAIRKLRLRCLGGEARRLAGLGKGERAATYAKKLVESRYKDLIRNPGQPFDTYLWVANQFYHQDDYLRAAEMYQAIFERFGSDASRKEDLAKLTPVMAKCYIESLEWQKALGVLREIEKTHPRSAPIQRDIARCLHELGEHDKALEICAELRDGFPAGSEGWWDAKWRIVEMLFAQKKYEQVHRMITQDVLVRPSLGGPKFKERFLKLRQACAQALGPKKSDS